MSCVDAPQGQKQPQLHPVRQPADRRQVRGPHGPLHRGQEQLLALRARGDHLEGRRRAALLLPPARHGRGRGGGAGRQRLLQGGAAGTADGVRHGSAEEFDAILMDCMMPVMDGLTATKEIRRWEKKAGREKTTIIALTASVLEEDIHNCFAAGMDAYLPKPYKSNQLFELFNELKLA